MKKRMNLFAVALFVIFTAGTAYSQLLVTVGGVILPANPTSADNLTLSTLNLTCGGILRYKADPYRVSMVQNDITIRLGEHVLVPVPTCPPDPIREEFDLGRLPAGRYTLTMIESAVSDLPNSVRLDHVPFTVADARATKAPPYVRLDYSGQWWDPNDSGWGLFIWHDARDRVLAAWFTYTPDGKPMWYVFQPTWQTSSATVEVPLMQTSRPPGTTSPPPNPSGGVSYTLAGTASLDFTNYGTVDEGKLTYTFTGGQKLVRTIQRFKP